MRYLIVLEQTAEGIAVQVPDLAIVTFGENVEAARLAASAAIQANLEAYREAGLAVPEKQPVETHLDNPELSDLLFAYVDVPEACEKIAA